MREQGERGRLKRNKSRQQHQSSCRSMCLLKLSFLSIPKPSVDTLASWHLHMYMHTCRSTNIFLTLPPTSSILNIHHHTVAAAMHPPALSTYVPTMLRPSLLLPSRQRGPIHSRPTPPDAFFHAPTHPRSIHNRAIHPLLLPSILLQATAHLSIPPPAYYGK